MVSISRKILGMVMVLVLTSALAHHAGSADPVPCDIFNDPDCANAAPPPETGCDQKCRMRRQFVQYTKGQAVLGVWQYSEVHTRLQFHDCDTCKNDASGYCYFDKNTKDTLTDRTCTLTTLPNKFQLLPSTPLCDLKNWKAKSFTGDVIMVEAIELNAKDENFKMCPSNIRECKAK